MGDQDCKLLPAPADPGVTTFSNGIRLSDWEWIGVGLVAALFVVFAPSLWRQGENFSLEPDHRMPHDLSSDYWLYERFAALAADRYDTLLLGDSVVWGEYVTGQETLSHYLNQLSGQERYANPRLDAAHPLALARLAQHHFPRSPSANPPPLSP